MAMKRYLLFTGYEYSGPYGADSFEDAFDTLDEARAAAKAMLPTYTQFRWWNVLDTATGEVWETLWE